MSRGIERQIWLMRDGCGLRRGDPVMLGRKSDSPLVDTGGYWLQYRKPWLECWGMVVDVTPHAACIWSEGNEHWFPMFMLERMERRREFPEVRMVEGECNWVPDMFVRYCPDMSEHFVCLGDWYSGCPQEET